MNEASVTILTRTHEQENQHRQEARDAGLPAYDCNGTKKPFNTRRAKRERTGELHSPKQVEMFQGF